MLFNMSTILRKLYEDYDEIDTAYRREYIRTMKELLVTKQLNGLVVRKYDKAVGKIVIEPCKLYRCPFQYTFHKLKKDGEVSVKASTHHYAQYDIEDDYKPYNTNNN